MNKNKTPFELIHCDVWGPFAVKDHLGAQFFLTIVDDFTRSTWVSIINSKTQTKSSLQSFFSLIETQLNSKIRIIRTDFGTEFHLHDFLASKGVIH